MPSVLVIDASVLAAALGDDDESGELARERLAGQRLAAPDLIYLETQSVWRRQAGAGLMLARRADLALRDLADLPIEVAAHRGLLPRCWELRHNISVYDAAYVALAEVLGVPLLTGDRRLSRAAGPECTIEVLGA